MMPKDKPPEDDKTPPIERRPPMRAAAPDPNRPPPERRTVEQWAEQKGMLPKFLRVEGSVLSDQRLNPEYWKLSVALAHRRWTGSELVTEAEFDTAVKEASAHIHR